MTGTPLLSWSLIVQDHQDPGYELSQVLTKNLTPEENYKMGRTCNGALRWIDLASSDVAANGTVVLTSVQPRSASVVHGIDGGEALSIQLSMPAAWKLWGGT